MISLSKVKSYLRMSHVAMFEIFGLQIKFVIRHAFQELKDEYDRLVRRNEKTIGVSFKQEKAVGKKDISNPQKWSENFRKMTFVA